MRWIVVDGIDGSGKSTHSAWIREHYEAKGEKVMVRVHPSTSWSGRKSRRALQSKGRVMSLLATVFFILDVLGSVRRLKRDASQYQTIIFVRYLMATAYLPERFAPMGYDFFSRLLPVPRRLLVIDIDPVLAHQRITERQQTREMFEDVPSLQKVRHKILMLAKRGKWVIIDNNVPEDVARESLLSAIEHWDSNLEE